MNKIEKLRDQVNGTVYLVSIDILKDKFKDLSYWDKLVDYCKAYTREVNYKKIHGRFSKNNDNLLSLIVKSLQLKTNFWKEYKLDYTKFNLWCKMEFEVTEDIITINTKMLRVISNNFDKQHLNCTLYHMSSVPNLKSLMYTYGGLKGGYVYPTPRIYAATEPTMLNSWNAFIDNNKDLDKFEKEISDTITKEDGQKLQSIEACCKSLIYEFEYNGEATFDNEMADPNKVYFIEGIKRIPVKLSKLNDNKITFDNIKERYPRIWNGLQQLPNGKSLTRDMKKVFRKDKVSLYENFSEKLSDIKSKTKLPEGTFTNKAATIKKILVENSKNKNDCIKKINFYINRAGKNLKNKTEIMKAKKMIENMITFNDLTERLNAINHNEENFALNRFQKAIVLGTMGLGLLGGKIHCEDTHINEPTKIEKVRSRKPARNFDKEYKEDKLKDLKDQLQQLKSGKAIPGEITKLRDTIIDPPEPEDISLLVKMQGDDVEKYQKEYEQKLLNYYEQVKHNQERRNQYKLEDEKDELTRKEMIKELEKQIKELEELLEKNN